MGFVLCALNVLWFAALVLSLVWNACSGSIKGWCAGTILDACLGDEERGVGTVEEARAVIARQSETIAEHVAALEERDVTIAERDAEIAERDDTIAELRAPTVNRGR